MVAKVINCEFTDVVGSVLAQGGDTLSQHLKLLTLYDDGAVPRPFTSE